MRPRKKFADSREELAELITKLGFPVSAKAIQNWLRDPRYESECPKPRSGRHNVFEWLGFMVASGVKRADERVALDDGREDGEEEPRTVIDWKMRREQLMCTQLERAILRDDGKLLIAIELEIALGQLVAGVSVALDHFAPSAARFVVGLRDIHDVQAKLQSEIDAVKQRINAARYLDDCVEEVAESFPFDSETEEIFKRVSFSGQDRDAFVDLVRCSTIAALRLLGARTIQSTSQQSDGSKDAQTEIPLSPESNSPGSVAQAEITTASPRRKRRSVTRARKRGARAAEKE